MKFRTILTSIIIAACTFAGAAQNQTEAKHSAARRAHLAAHKEQLANHKSRLDKTVLDNMLKNEINARENGPQLSASSSALLNDLVTEAYRHLGKPYVHGAKGPSQFDCSGFTSYVYKQFGLSISPGSRIQYTQGSAVDRYRLRTGDLVFFTSRSSGRNVGHVGMVVKADNEKGTFTFVHASIRGVKVSNSEEAYYKARYVGARRIVEK